MDNSINKTSFNTSIVLALWKRCVGLIERLNAFEVMLRVLMVMLVIFN